MEVKIVVFGIGLPKRYKFIESLLAKLTDEADPVMLMKRECK